jgi:hypothetical protein
MNKDNEGLAVIGLVVVFLYVPFSLVFSGIGLYYMNNVDRLIEQKTVDYTINESIKLCVENPKWCKNKYEVIKFDEAQEKKER